MPKLMCCDESGKKHAQRRSQTRDEELTKNSFDLLGLALLDEGVINDDMFALIARANWGKSADPCILEKIQITQGKP